MRRKKGPTDLSSYFHGVVPGRAAREAERVPPTPDISRYFRDLIPPQRVQPAAGAAITLPSPIEVPSAAEAPAAAVPTEEPAGIPSGLVGPTGLPSALPGVAMPVDIMGAVQEAARGVPERDLPELQSDVPTAPDVDEAVPVYGTVIDNFSPKQHGVTVAAPEGTAIHSRGAGVIEYAGMFDAPGWGNMVIVNHGDRRKSLYAYASDVTVREGDRVEKGQEIARVGSTGAMDTPGLYFEEWNGQLPITDSGELFSHPPPPGTGERVALPESLERRLKGKPGLLKRITTAYARAAEEMYPGAAERVLEGQTADQVALKVVQEALRPLGEEVTRPIAGAVQAKLRRAPSTAETLEMMEGVSRGENIPELTTLAYEGLLPPPDKLPPETAAMLRERGAEHMLEPAASRVRAGREIELISTDFKADHPVLAVMPVLGQKALSEFFVKPYILYPERAPAEATMDLVGGLVIAKGFKLGRKAIRAASKGKYLGIDVTKPLKNFLGRGNVTLTADTWKAFVDGSLDAGFFSDETARALKNLTEDHITKIADEIAEIPGQANITIAIPKSAATVVKRPAVKAVAYGKTDLVPIEQLDFYEVWRGNFADVKPDMLAPTDAELSRVIEGVHESVVGAATTSRRAVGTTDVQVLRDFGKAVHKSAEVEALAKRYGADAVLNRMDEAAVEVAKQAETPLQAWTRETASEVAGEMVEEGQRGFALVKRGGIFRRGEGAPPIADDELKAALYAARGKAPRLNRFGRWANDKYKEVKDLITIEHEPDLVRAGEFQFRDDLRTMVMPAGNRATEEASLQIGHNVFGGLRRAEEDTLLNIMGLRSFVQSHGEGLVVPRNITRETVMAELQRQMDYARKKMPKVIRALDRYQEYSRLVGEDLVKRGKISPEDLKDFYLPHLVMDHMPEWWYKGPFAKRRLRDPYRAYVKERIGSAKDIAISKDALMIHYSTVLADNNFDDAATYLMNKYDHLPGMSKASKQMLFGKQMRPRPAKAYKITIPGPDGKPVEQVFRGIQYQPGNAVYRVLAVDEKLLAQSLEDALLMPAHEAELVAASGMDEILKFLEDVGPRGGNAIRQVLALGGYNKTYLVKDAIYNKMVRIKEPGFYFPGMYTLMGVTSFWKRFTLSPVGAGLPFHVANIIGDGEALYRTAPGAFRETPLALKLLWNLNPSKKRTRWGELTDFEEYVMKVMIDKDTLGAGFMNQYVELMGSDPAKWADPRKWVRMVERGGALRESILRIAMTAHQLRRVTAGKSVVGREFSKVIAGLDPDSAAAYIGRNFAVDYIAVPDWYRRLGRGLLVPFGTFWQKNAANYAAYGKNAPGWFTAKFVAPRVALWAYNNSGEQDDPKSPRWVEERLPDWIRQRDHFNFPAYDKDGDGEPDTTTVVAPELPFSMAARFLGLDTLGENITLMRQGLLTPKQAAKQQLFDVVTGAPRVAHDLMSPMVKIMEGFLTNKDPFTGRIIVPKELEDVPEAKMRMYGEFMVGQLLTPVGRFIGTMRAGDHWTVAIKQKVSLFRGMGIREVNLKAEEARDMIAIARDSEAIINRADYKLEQEYIYGKTDVDEWQFFNSDAAKTIQQEALDEDVFVTPQDVLDIVMNPAVRIRRLGVLIKRARTKEEKKAYLLEQNQLTAMRAMEIVSRTARAARLRTIEKIMQAQPVRKSEDVFDYSKVEPPRKRLGRGMFGR